MEELREDIDKFIAEFGHHSAEDLGEAHAIGRAGDDAPDAGKAGRTRPQSNGTVTLDDSVLSIPTVSAVCTYCTYWHASSGRTCRTYPAKDSIPMPIWNGRDMHVMPHGEEQHDQNGQPITFTPASDAKVPPGS